MKEHTTHLIKRRYIMMGIVVFLAVVAVIASYNFTITPTAYFGGKYNHDMLYFLIVYKFIELPTLYYLLFHRHVAHIRDNASYEDRFDKIKKNTKLLLFLIPQGNTIFGIIAFKLTGNILYFLMFSCIALITLFLVKPNKLFKYI